MCIFFLKFKDKVLISRQITDGFILKLLRKVCAKFRRFSFSKIGRCNTNVFIVTRIKGVSRERSLGVTYLSVCISKKL